MEKNECKNNKKVDVRGKCNIYLQILEVLSCKRGIVFFFFFGALQRAD